MGSDYAVYTMFFSSFVICQTKIIVALKKLNVPKAFKTRRLTLEIKRFMFNIVDLWLFYKNVKMRYEYKLIIKAK